MKKPLRVGIIGANLRGSWGVRAHLPALAALDGVEAIAVATQHRESADATAARFGVALAFADPRQLIEHPQVDVVSICVRVQAHKDLVLQALSAGKHVYCEWPLGRDSDEAKAMLEAAGNRQRLHVVGLQARLSPALRYVRDLIAQGAIGQVRSTAFTHSRDWYSHPTSGSAYIQDRSSGAHFLSIPGGHSLDAMCWLLGEFQTLSAIVTTSLQQLVLADSGAAFRRTSADQVLVSGTLRDGIVASFRLSGAASPGTGVRFEISGDNGDLIISVPDGGSGFQTSHLRVQRTTASGALDDITVPEHYFSVPAAIRTGAALNVGEAYLRMRDCIAGKKTDIASFADALSRHQSLDQIEAAAR